MYCQHCGREIPNQSRFCSYCGAAQNGTDGQTESGNHLGLIVFIGILAVAVMLFVVWNEAKNTQTPIHTDVTRPSSSASAQITANQSQKSLSQKDGKTYDTIAGEWSEESYYFGNGGSAAIMEFSSEVEDCRSLTFYLKASGNYGAHFNGTWKVFVKSHGQWEHAADLDFLEPDGSFTITFDDPTDFTAITAYPTIQGNASYSVLYGVYDVYCRP